jgi:serine/threonine protein kinase
MSEEAKDFIRSLLTRNASKRPSAAQALQHSWLNYERKPKSLRRKK